MGSLNFLGKICVCYKELYCLPTSVNVLYWLMVTKACLIVIHMHAEIACETKDAIAVAVVTSSARAIVGTTN